MVGRLPLLVAALAGALALFTVAAGCGGADSEPAPDSQVLSAGDISEEFEEETGRPLEETIPDPAWEQLGFGLNAPPAVLEEFGTFSIYVVDPDDPEALESLLRDKATGEPLTEDENGVFWERDSLSGTWIAHKRYGDNVVLTWFSERDEAETDERFERLDEILSGLASA